MNPKLLPALATSGILLGWVSLYSRGIAEGKAPSDQQPSMHASLAAYPTAVISLKDPKTETTFYVESNGRRLVSLGKNGQLEWIVDVLKAGGIAPDTGKPLIRHLRIEGDHVWVTIGKSTAAKVEMRTGKSEFVGSD